MQYLLVLAWYKQTNRCQNVINLLQGYTFTFKGKIGLYSPNTGIVDWGLVARKFGEVFKKSGGKIVTGFEVC